ncbi:MAG: hypothetical protein ABTQ73_00365 [Caldilineales bacterium]
MANRLSKEILNVLTRRWCLLVMLFCIAGCYAPSQSSLPASSAAGTASASPTASSTLLPADSLPAAEPHSTKSGRQAYQLSYISSGDIWLADMSRPATAPRRITDSGQIVRYGWAPDGSALWHETLPGKLTLVDLSTGEQHTIAGETNTDATWSIDSAGLVYVSTIPDAEWSVGSPVYKTEVWLFDRKSLKTTRLLDGTEPDSILTPPVRLQMWPIPRWKYARPLFVDQDVILLDIMSKGSTQSDKETFLNFLGFFDRTTGSLDIKTQGDMPIEEDPAGFETYGVPLEWQLASDGRTLAIVEPFTQLSKDPAVSSGVASAWWVLDLTSLTRQSLMPTELVCEEITSNAPAAWGEDAGIAWRHQAPDVTVSFWQIFQPLRQATTNCPISNEVVLFELERQGNTYLPTLKLPGAMEPAFTEDDRLLAYSTRDQQAAPSSPALQPRDDLPAKLALRGYSPLLLAADLDPTTGNPEFVNALLDSQRFTVHVADGQQHEITIIPHAHSPAWRPSQS